MSDLKAPEKKLFEKLFGMASGYVMDFTNQTFAEFFSEHGIDIYSDRYAFNGNSKAKRLRAFWQVEPNEVVADVLSDLVRYWRRATLKVTPEALALADECERVIEELRWRSMPPTLSNLKAHADRFDAHYLARQVQRMEKSIERDPALAIGTAKEVIETCCRTILEERGKQVPQNATLPQLIKEVRQELRSQLIPQELPQAAKGRESVQRTLGGLASVIQGIAELRNLYGTGHGKHANTPRISPRLAKLAVGAAVTLANFLFDTHKNTN